MSVGYEVYHYGVEGSESDAVNIDLLSREEWEDLRRQSFAELYPGREMRAQDLWATWRTSARRSIASLTNASA